MNKLGKIVIIGAGKVGSMTAFCLVQNEICNEVVLIDAKPARAKAEVMDIRHCLSLQNKEAIVKDGDYSECTDASLVILTAAAPVKFGETRLDMIIKNTKIVDSILPEIIKNRFQGKFIVVSNPVDVISSYIQKEYNLNPDDVIGTGTILDTARLKDILSNEYGMSRDNIEGFCMGEHGDSLIIPWSHIRCKSQILQISEEEKEIIRSKTIQSAYEIMKGKGNTSYAIAVSILTLIKALLSEEPINLPVSVLLSGQYDIQDVYLSVPVEIGKNKIHIKEVELTEEEKSQLKKSADILYQTFKEIK